MYSVSWNTICASGLFGMLSSFLFVWNNLFKLFSNVNKNRVSILRGQFSRPKDVKSLSGILQYIFFLINAWKLVTLSPKFASVLSSGVVDVFDLDLYCYLTQQLFSYSNVSLISSRDFLGRCFSCWAAYW